jgi:hypothetical protein
MAKKKTTPQGDGQAGYTRPERHSRSVLLHGYGGAALRVFGTYTVNGAGEPRKIVVRAYHRDSAKAPWQPSDASVHNTLDELEEEIKDWAVRATALGYKRLVKRQAYGEFTKESIPVPPKPPKGGVFTKGGIPDPLSVKHGGGGGRRG